MVYSDIYLLPKSNSSTIKSEQGNLTNAPNQPNVTNHVSNHLKHHSNKKLSSTGSTSNRSSGSSRFNETNSNVTNSNVTIKSDLNKFNKNPKLAPEIIFLIKEHAKTLETINQISKKLQEIELKVDDISQRLSKENSLNSHYNARSVNNSGDRTATGDSKQQETKTNHHKIDSNQQKELNQTRLPYSAYKDVDHHLSNNHLSNNLSNNATNIPNQILSDDSGGEYGNKTTTKTVSDDELLSILEKITKCSHHILQTQQAYQQQGTAIYSSLSKPYAYGQPQNLVSNQFNNQQFNQPSALQAQVNTATTNSHNHLQSRPQYHPDIYSNLQQPNLYSGMNPYNPYLLNAKSPIKTAANQPPIHQQQQQQQQTIVPLKYSTAPVLGQTTSLNELLFEPNVERFLSNLDQLVCNDDTNLAAILGNNQPQTTHLINSTNLPLLQHAQNHQFIPLSPHHQATSTPISSQPIPILSANPMNLRTTCLNLSPNLLNSTLNSNYGNMINTVHNVQSSINQQAYLNNLNHLSLHDPSQSTNVRQQIYDWQEAKELLEKRERERTLNQLKQADEWLGMIDNTIKQNRTKYSQSTKSTKSNTLQEGNEGR